MSEDIKASVNEEEVLETAEEVEVGETTEKGFDEIKKDIAFIPEEEEEKLNEKENLNDSLSKLADSICKVVEKKTTTPKTEPAKKPFKLGFWGYLALVVVVKGAVEITKAVADSKRPRR